jgi:dienelactone hydrolase
VPRRVRTRAAALVTALACSTPVIASVSAASAANTVASGDGWSVERVAGGYEVTLDLTTPLPIVSDAPTILVDGVDVGYATESANGRSLVAYTTDPDVTRAKSVTKGWASGSQAKTAEGGTESTAERNLQGQLQRLAAGKKVRTSEDPAAIGSYAVTEAEYDFGNQAVPLEGIGGVRGEMTGKLYLTDATGARPVVLLMHGRHSSCSQGTPNPLRWPCGPNQVNVRSYLGYEGTARVLASHGYNVVSIAVNAVNSNDNQLAADYGAYARGQMVLHTLGMLRDATAGKDVAFHDAQTDADVTLDQALVAATTRSDQPAAPAGVTASSLQGRFDLDHVGIMGHSRGGEGVMSAATLNQGLAEPFGIEAVLPLAPVDFGRMTLPDTPMMVMLPYCDGDVSNQQGQHMYDDSRTAFHDNVQRSAVWVMGANHNFFNSVWTPGKYPYATGDDWSRNDTTSTCATVDPTRLTADEEYQVGVSYMSGYFRYVMGGEKQFAPLFNGTVKPSTPMTDFADVRVMASQPHNRTTMLADLTKDSAQVTTTGAASAEVCVNATGVTLPQALPLCSTIRTSSGSFPHWAQMRFGGNVPAFPVTRLTWTSKDAALHVAVPKAEHNVSHTAQLTLKTMPDETVPAGTDFTITLADRAGKTWSTLASSVNPLAVNRLPGGTNSTLNKLVMQQLTIPTSEITGVNLRDLAEVRITPEVGADGTEAGGVYLSDLAFDTPALGATIIEQHTTINVSSTTVDEGDGPGTVDIPVWLNHASDVPVTGYVSSVGSTTGRAGIGMVPVTFAPGETQKTVSMPLNGDDLPSSTGSTAVVLSVTNTQNAAMGDHAFGYLTVREDDGVTD